MFGIGSIIFLSEGKVIGRREPIREYLEKSPSVRTAKSDSLRAYSRSVAEINGVNPVFF
jgi:hypothetical protein